MAAVARQSTDDDLEYLTRAITLARDHRRSSHDKSEEGPRVSIFCSLARSAVRRARRAAPEPSECLCIYMGLLPETRFHALADRC